MSNPHARAGQAAHPPSTAGTPERRAHRRTLRIGLAVAAAGIAVAAPMVAADPGAAPVEVALGRISSGAAQPATAVQGAEAPDSVRQLGNVALVTTLSKGEIQRGADLFVASNTTTTTTTTTTTPEPPAPDPAPEPAPAPAPVPAPEPAPAPPPPPPAPTAAPAGSAWDRLAQCESGGNWSINTGNGYYGGLQFSLSSWRGVGGSGYPHEHSRETQIAMGERLRAQGGWGHWPSCARQLGLM